ncbi:MAG: PH domain-containing protein [Streptosporangiaceae bacterium]
MSPRVLAVHPLRGLRPLIIPVVVVLVAGGTFDAGRIVTVPVALALVLVGSLVRWLTFTYRIRSDRLEISRGLLGRRTSTIPLDRIRGVDLTASALHRLLGLAVVRIEAAAGGERKNEGSLDAVTLEEAERLRAVLLRRAGVGGEPEPRSADEEHVLAELRPAWWRYAPLSAGYLLAPLAVLGSIVGLASEVASDLGVDPTPETVRDAFEGGLVSPWLIIGLVAGFVVCVPLFAVASFALVNWHFRVLVRDGSLVCERGLLTRRSVSLERRKIRGFELREGILERLGGAASLQAVVTGVADQAHRAQLLPIAPRVAALTTASRAVASFHTALRPHPRAARTRRLVRAVVPWILLAGLAVAAHQIWLALAFGCVAALGIPLGLDRYRSLGHATDEACVSVRSGSLRRVQAVVQHRAIVGWTIRQTWFQRRVGLATLVVGVGAGSGGYPAVDLAANEATAFAREVAPELLAPFSLELSRGDGEC